MKIAVLADIHGNLPALNAVLAEIQIENVNQILVAGDILGGPFPVEVISKLRDLKANMIRGNFEEYLLQIKECLCHLLSKEQFEVLRKMA